MGNSNQCKIEHKISNDYGSMKAGRLCRECNSPCCIMETKRPHPADTVGMSCEKNEVLRRNVCYWAHNREVTALFKHTEVYSQNG